MYGSFLRYPFCFRVTDDRYALQDTTVNILSSFLLSSDLQGYVEAPSFYFSGDDSRTSYLLDLLMLTQAG